MPDVSGCIQVSADGQYIFATGTYKPRVRCFDVYDLSMKFERCLHAEAIKMIILSDGYEKLVFLEEERFIEFHVQYGHYYKTRLPKFGRDFLYHPTSSELYMVGSGPCVYRLNLEQGTFMSPLETGARSLTACALNPEHQLFVCGTAQGGVEAWDPRCRKRVASLDCRLHAQQETPLSKDVSMAVSSLKFRGPLCLAAGTSTGQVLMYDIRAAKPRLVKDHQYGLPIKSLECNEPMGLMASMDSKVVKLWDYETGQPYTAIQPETDLNQLCIVPNTGLMLIANEAPKILVYYVPSLGAAPKWCSFLDSITEELEESDQPTVYDDYKFVTRSELGELGLEHAVGSNLLRAYMHGFFVDARLHAKARQLAAPFAYEHYRKHALKEKLEKERKTENSVKKRQEKPLPKVNKELAQRLRLEKELMGDKIAGKKKAKGRMAETLLEDSRFGALFANPEFEVDPASEEYRLLNPALVRLESTKLKRQQRLARAKRDTEPQQERTSAALTQSDVSASDRDSESSEDDAEYRETMRRTHKELKRERLKQDKLERIANAIERRTEERGGVKEAQSAPQPPVMFELRSGEEFAGWNAEMRKGNIRKDMRNMSLGERTKELQDEHMGESELTRTTGGGMEMTFSMKKKSKRETKEGKQAQHIRERRKLRRSAQDVTKTLKKPKLPSAGTAVVK